MSRDCRATPAWMRGVLLAAAFYNLAWGLWAILWPRALFGWAGMTPPNHPQVWQCLGMVIGVYGLGYAAAAAEPARHWPIVLVGLLGKVLGPIGFVWSVCQGTLPLVFGATIIPNDLIWWLPFGLILHHAYSTHAARFGNSDCGCPSVSSPIMRTRPMLPVSAIQTADKLLSRFVRFPS